MPSVAETVMRLRNTANPEDLAREFEPLCQAIAALSDDTRQNLEELKGLGAALRTDMETARLRLEGATKTANVEAVEIGSKFKALIEEQKKTAWKFSGRMWLMALLGSLAGGAGAAIGLWIWLSPSKSVKQAATHWQELTEAYNRLDPAKKKQFRELAGWPDPQQTTAPRKR